MLQLLNTRLKDVTVAIMSLAATENGEFIAYYRVSTQRQGKSGLGLEAQKTAVADYMARIEGRLVDEFIEIESGRKTNQLRPQLNEAIEKTKAMGATLVIAKLDRLARNMAFTSMLMESGVKFVCCDMPEADHFTIHILAAVAEKEAKDISNRTKAALAAAKARGKILGKPENLTKQAQLAGAESNRVKAINRTRRATYTARLLRQNGKSLRAIADELNDNGFRTSKNKFFSATQVKRMLDRTN